MTNLDSVLKSRDIIFADKGQYSQSYGFVSSHVWMWELDHKEGWALKNWGLWTVVLEKTWESLGLQEVQTNQSLRKSVLNIHWKDWCWSSTSSGLWCEELIHSKRPWSWERLKQEEKGVTEYEMVGWHHWLDGHEFEQAPGDGDRQGSLACYSPWGCKELDTTEWLKNRVKAIPAGKVETFLNEKKSQLVVSGRRPSLIKLRINGNSAET